MMMAENYQPETEIVQYFRVAATFLKTFFSVQYQLQMCEKRVNAVLKDINRSVICKTVKTFALELQLQASIYV